MSSALPNSLTPREKELVARHLLLHIKEIAPALRDRRWLDLAALAEYARAGIPNALSKTDPYLYRGLCAGLAEYHILGYDSLNPTRLHELAAASAQPA